MTKVSPTTYTGYSNRLDLEPPLDELPHAEIARPAFLTLCWAITSEQICQASHLGPRTPTGYF